MLGIIMFPQLIMPPPSNMLLLANMFFYPLSVISDSESLERIHDFNMNINIVWSLFGITMKAEQRAVTTLTFKSQVWLENTETRVI